MLNPLVLTGQELEPTLFPFIKENKFKDRVIQFDKYVKPEYIELYNSLKSKLGY